MLLSNIIIIPSAQDYHKWYMKEVTLGNVIIPHTLYYHMGWYMVDVARQHNFVSYQNNNMHDTGLEKHGYDCYLMTKLGTPHGGNIFWDTVDCYHITIGID